MRYAQIDANGIVLAVSDLSGTIDAPHMIPIGADVNVIGRQWTGSEFVVPEPPPEPPRTILSRQEFIDRWEFAELAALKGLTLQVTQDGIEAATFWDVVMSRDTIDLTSALAQSARLACQGWGILDATAADRVFGY